MFIGQPQRIIEVVPADVPVPEILPDPVPTEEHEPVPGKSGAPR